MPTEPKTYRIELATGLSYQLLEWGSASAERTVILVHGFLDLARSWQPVVEAGFGAGLRLIAPDMRGHGRSDRVGPGGYYHFLDYVADLHCLVEQFTQSEPASSGEGEVAGARKRICLVGHSMGGSIVSYYAGSFSSRVEKIALLEGLGPPEDSSPLPSRIAPWVSAWLKQRQAEPKRYASLEAAAARLMRLDPLLREELALWLAGHSTEALADGGYRFLHDPLHLTPGPHPFRLDTASQFWARIECPALLIDGAESVFKPEDMADRRAQIARAEHVVLQGAGHMMMRHQPRALAEQLQRFFSE